MITITDVDTLAKVPATQWDSLASAASLYQSRAWLRWAEAHHGLPTRYVLASGADGTLLGAVATYLMRDVADKLTRWYDPVRMFLTPYCDTSEAQPHWFPVLLVGGCSGGHSEILHAPRLDRAGRTAVNRALLARCRAIAEEHDCGSLAFMYAPEEVCDEVVVALAGPTRKIVTSAKAAITLGAGGGDFEGYLNRFPSARRSKLRKEVQAYAAAGGNATAYPLGEVLPRIAPLLGAHQRKYGDPVTDSEAERYLRHQAAYLGANSTVFVDERDGDIRGFTLCYEHGDAVYAQACGFDPQGAAPFAYFNLSVYAPLRLAAEHRRAKLELGLGSYQGKRLRGADVTALWSVVIPPEHLSPECARVFGRPSPQAIFAGVAGTRPSQRGTTQIGLV
jgi:predicted N-acyltransferase